MLALIPISSSFDAVCCGKCPRPVRVAGVGQIRFIGLLARPVIGRSDG